MDRLSKISLLNFNHYNTLPSLEEIIINIFLLHIAITTSKVDNYNF